jgi:hypothetical protein
MDVEQAAVPQAATTKTIPSAETPAHHKVTPAKEATAYHEVTPAKEATTSTASTSSVNKALTALVSAAEKDPTLWNTLTFSAVMSAVVAQLVAKPPA